MTNKVNKIANISFKMIAECIILYTFAKKIFDSMIYKNKILITHDIKISGVNPVSGFTIYAIITKIISIDSCHE